MALASHNFGVGLRILGSKPKLLFGNAPQTTFKVSVAYITGRASRTEPAYKPKPWPYRGKRGYNNLHALLDGTKKRLGDNSKVIVVEGPPAIGKSNLARALAEELEMKYFPMANADSYYINQYGFDIRTRNHEFKERYRSFDEKDFIKNPKSEKTVRLEMILWYQKFTQYADALSHLLNTGEGIILDRCVYSSSVFADTLFEMGYLNKLELTNLKKLRDAVMHELMKPHLIIYLDAPASVVEANLKNRGLGEEKVWNRQMLEILEKKYKHDFLKSITTHAELLAYDWSTPGDAEIIVEDIERIDFDRFDLHDPKMEDWRIKQDYDWCEKRWNYTHRLNIIENGISSVPVYEVPALCIMAEDEEEYERTLETIPGHAFQYGFNEGDNFLFSTKIPRRTWKDHSVEGAKPAMA
ncbi:NADH dehydrogenase [ubiquinone] 1 alpha subcomplex subunit 10, mitochondrial [Orchesella cincta]|uniref:NADH dehydrogenase [ubiquinone] 1 alpha subcomplex subunit 10, mitochondrial n=1 Tax=Orchesella cincta TaxID=48709 RepID=A0A1D2N7V7_ORCCI|nr:NADH dehydrogenase [ubiquinone] 1 alpha subcomplex subunit 10, mitochondrial [Orchesella cincta]